MLVLNQKNLLAIHLLRDEKVVRKALGKLDPSRDFEEEEVMYQFIWDISKDYFTKYGSLIPHDTFMTEAVRRFTAEPDHPAWQYVERIEELLKEAYSSDFQPSTEYVIQTILQPWLDRRVLNLINNWSEEHLISTSEEINSMVQQIQDTANTSRISAVDNKNIFDLSDPEVAGGAIEAPEPTGCKAFDLVVGGMQRSHMLGVLAPTGGGKTLMGIHSAISVAEGGQHAYLFSYEQPVLGRTPQLRNRAWACALNMDADSFLGPTAKYPPEVRKALSDWGSKYGQYFHAYGMVSSTQGGGGVAEIDTILQGELDEGREPYFVVIDWLGDMARSYMAEQGLDVDKLTPVMGKLLNEFRALTNKYDIQLVINHQLSADGGGRKIDYRPTVYQAADFKKFAINMDGCIIIPKADANGVTRVYADKLRGAKDEVQVRLVGARSRIEVVDGEWVPVRTHNNTMEWYKTSDVL